ncbi:MAG: amidohydrolase family protein [Armatimonadetes bacterium]|nr:amidohydrolase family protein [Armatimonadota bacterium]
MPDGDYTFGPRDGELCFVRNGISLMPEDTGFASSVIRLDDAVRVMVQQVGVDLETALRMASAVPAAVMGWSDRKGMTAGGMDADIVVLDDDLNARRTIVAGRLAYSA